ncbi:MAG TPA: FAD-binding and (Fe-S)-binding domain-containing protein [Anaeromyxobacteraceae bacterium]|nr:FAD-binding and (Fe-S)-binding domain-containing protein [Anaeromyxobacteraceae bacterium]
MSNDRDVAALPPAHRRFWEEAAQALPPDRLHCDPLRTLAWGTDASFYRLVPKIVAKVRTGEEVARLLGAARRHGTPVTFRAAGTSLSGQTVTESVLLVLAGGWRELEVLDGGARIRLGPGVIGAEANAALSRHGRKIGPDPASIGACMVGGIAANNASGMCCGTAENSYRTVDRMRIVLADGAELDTGDPASRRRFAETHADLLAGLSAIRGEIVGDPELSRRIREKYRIKNTTGYSLNAFLDFEDPVDVLLHLMVGSEGTLGFIAELTFRTVEDHPHRASALVVFPDIETAARATQRLAGGPVAAVEMMDRASLRSVERKPGMPEWLAGLAPDACALLCETRARAADEVAARVQEVKARLEGLPTLVPWDFTPRKVEYERLWDIRRGLFPAVGAARRLGTTVVIEDVAFPMERLAAGTVDLQRLMHAHGYDEGILFGHALAGNLHFVFTQDFGAPAEVARYGRFMDEVCEMVVRRYDGSLKGEHGTGRNMAPYVELEWGARAYGLMRRVKALLDPEGILNPGVILNDDPRVHLANLKALPPAHEIVDRCTECGFCEPRCPSRDLTLTPRQRITVRREIARLAASGGGSERLERLASDYGYLGEETCATDGLCATACPVGIDTGELTKRLRAASRTARARELAEGAAARFGAVQAGVRTGLAAADAAHAVLGTRLMGALARGARRLSGGRLPLWNPAMPRPARARIAPAVNGGERAAVYLPSCVVRTMGPARADPEEREASEAMLSVLAKAGYDVVLPEGLESLCCGMAFESKGFPEVAEAKARELDRALLAASRNGALPVVCETSPCLHRMRKTLDPRLRLYEPVELVHDHLMDRLAFSRRAGTVAVHLTCSSARMGLGAKLEAVARACAERVVAPPVGCCGFAGDRGFTHPELNASAVAGLRAALPPGCAEGYSNSRTCEIGLSLHSGIPYRSILLLVDRCTAPRGGAEGARA